MRKFSVRRIILILIDLICIILASFLALFLRFNGEIPSLNEQLIQVVHTFQAG